MEIIYTKKNFIVTIYFLGGGLLSLPSGGRGGRSGLANRPLGELVQVAEILPSRGVVICTTAPSFFPLQSS